MKPAASLLVALGASLCASAANMAPEVYRIPLPVGGLPEAWDVQLPDVPARRAWIDLELAPSGFCKLENRGSNSLFPPWARLLAFPDAVVSAGGAELHRERTELSVTTKLVARVYDGLTDYAGPSGSAVGGAGRAWGEESPLDPDVLGSVVRVEASAADVECLVFGTVTYSVSYGAFLGGELVLRVER